VMTVMSARSAMDGARDGMGYRVDGIVMASSDREAVPKLYRELAGQPWVEEVAWTLASPASLGSRRTPPVSFNEVSPEYFRVLGIELVRGRTFTRAEAEAAAAVTVLSESAARGLFG